MTDDENDIDRMLTADGQKISCVVVRTRTDNMDWSRMVISNIHQRLTQVDELIQVYTKNLQKSTWWIRIHSYMYNR